MNGKSCYRRRIPILIFGFALTLAAAPLLAQPVPGRVQGRVTAADGGAPIDCTIHLVPSGRIHATVGAYCREDGTFDAYPVPPGSYSLVAFKTDSEEYARHLWGFGSCNRSPINAACMDLEKGTPVMVRSGETSGFYAMELERSAQIVVNVDFPGTAPDTGVVRLFQEDGQSLYAGGLGVPIAWTVAPGSFRLTVEGAPTLQSFSWGNVPCSRWHCEPHLGEAIVLEPGETATGSFQLQPIAPYEGCAPNASTLCLNQGRFEVRAVWGDYLGASGAGIAHQVTPDTGYFYFFTPNNVEVLVKALDACDHYLGHRFYFFAGGLTDVQVELRVKDTLTGEFQLYTNTLGTTFDPILDTDAFDTCNVLESPLPLAPAAAAAALAEAAAEKAAEPAAGDPQPAGLCDDSSPARACVTGDRFAVSAVYTTRDGYTREADARLLTEDTAAFWFFDRNNYEVMIKVLDACGTATPGFWVFGAGLTDIHVEVKVEDLATGRIKTYRRGPDRFAPIVDHASFPCN